MKTHIKCMIEAFKSPHRESDLHAWFAWFPVETSNDARKTAWLENVLIHCQYIGEGENGCFYFYHIRDIH